MEITQLWRGSVKILVAEADHMNCQLVESAFKSRRNRISVIGAAVNASQVLLMIRDTNPDVAVISARLQEGATEGYRVLQQIRAHRLRTRVVMLLDSRDRELVISAFRSGAHGVIFRDEPLQTLGKCIHSVHKGQVWVSSEHLGFLLDALAQTSPLRFERAKGVTLLSKREQDVVRLVADGLTNKAIAQQLALTEHTIRNYLFKIFDKIGVSSRMELPFIFFRRV